ncbi:hypothetical protein [Verrucomicrobium sp. BvORR106]|uniref:hypothetical protein n=1 Tax=Verrucomicrobium sp. BvORR106 TaxID=1403819 RepID=UPI000571FE29|nr:hypothetical protein [Verrucomicrobium sp. BvORR106]
MIPSSFLRTLFLGVVLAGTWLAPMTGAVAQQLAVVASAPAPMDPVLPWWERVKQPLAPEIETALAGVAEKVTPLRKKDLTDFMKAEQDWLVQTFQITDEAKLNALKTAADQAVEESIKPYPQKLTETHRNRLPSKEVAAAVAEIARWEPETLAWSRLVLGCTLPDELDVWKGAVKAALDPAQLATWEKRRTDAREGWDKQVKACITPWLNAGRMQGIAQVNARMDAMLPVMKLEADKATRLRETALKAVDQLCAEEEKRATEPMWFIAPARRQQFVETNPVFRAYVLDADPGTLPVWKELLAAVAGPDELARWDQHLADRKAKADKEIPGILKVSVDRVRSTWEKNLERDADQTLLALRLPKERLKTLEGVKRTVLERAEKRWNTLATEQLQKMEPSARDEIIKRGRGYYISLQNDDQPQNDTEWKKALEGLITPEERKQVEISNAERKVRREEQVGRLVLSELDRRLAFTSQQRVVLLPLVSKASLGDSRLFPTEPTEYGYDFQSQNFSTIAARVKEADLQPVLDESQLKAWKGLEKTQASEQQESSPKPVAKPDFGTRKPEPEDLEQMVSTFLYEKSLARQTNLMNAMVTAAEDAARVTGLAPDRMARLRTAARGAVEAAMDEWRPTVDSVVRGRLQGATVQDVGQRMTSIDSYYFNMYRSRKTEEYSVWQKALKAELSPEQFKKWEGEQKARQDFQNEAVAAFVLAEFDRKVLLNKEQSELLKPKLAAVIRDYQPDLSNYFSGSDGVPWYLQYYSMLIPVVGVTEKELKTIITPGQWDSWTKSNEYSNCMSYWGGIEQNHASRVRNK